MIEDQYKTKILPAPVHLKTVDGSAMSSLGKATLHCHITNFKFSHAFIICDKLPDTDILFGIDIQKRYPLSYSWDVNKQLFIQSEGFFHLCKIHSKKKLDFLFHVSELRMFRLDNGILS